MRTTRTRSPYFSPNSAMAPEAQRFLDVHLLVAHGDVGLDLLVDELLDLLDLAVRTEPPWEKSKRR